MDPIVAKSKLQSLASRIGFDECRVAPAERARHADEFLDWVAQGKAGDMGWLERNIDRRCDPREVLPGARSVVCLALNYYPGDQEPNPNYRIARYSWNDDYHDIIEDKLKDLDLAMQEMGGTQRYYTDTGPVLERDFASASGLGWNGKSTVQIHTRLGTWFFLAELITTLALEPDPPQNDHCGKCSACMTACPTNAIPRPHFVDAPRCISYLTIEHKGPIPEKFRESLGNRIYGCDDCLAVCPWNKFADTAHRHIKLAPRQELAAPQLARFLEFDDAGFRQFFSGSPIKRVGRDRFVRNCLYAAGNSGNGALKAQVESLKADPDPAVAEAAIWAAGKLSPFP